ncbi:MAG: hypothetical protein R3C26_22620 [Calditrichia bacterium]
MLPAITGILTSLLVIRFGSISLWGEFVYVTVVFSIVNSVIGWGNKEFFAAIVQPWATTEISADFGSDR